MTGLLAIRPPAESAPSQSGAVLVVPGRVGASPATLEEMTKKCPECAEIVKVEAIVCKHCHYRFDPPEAAREVQEAERQLRLRRDRSAGLIVGRECPTCYRIVEPGSQVCACGWRIGTL